MHLELSKEQYKKLLEMVYVGNFILSCNKDDRGESVTMEDLVEEAVFQAAAEHDFKEVEKQDGEFTAADEFSERMYSEIDEYCVTEAWRKITSWLADDAIQKMFSQKEWKKLTSKQKFIIKATVEDAIDEIFEEHGTSAVTIAGLHLDKDEIIAEVNAPEPVLPAIRLKYFGTNEKGEKPTDPNAVCAQCHRKNIILGATLDAFSSHPRIMCESCAVDGYQKDGGFNSREAAEARRRRIFDVSYLFQEMIVDAYLRKKQLGSLDDLDESTVGRLFAMGQALYNESIDRGEKFALEETVNQNDIEKKLLLKVVLADWGRFGLL